VAQRLPNEARLCRRCGAESVDGATRCALCGGSVAKAGTMRLLGWSLIGLGSFLFLFMGAITYYVAGIVSHSNDPRAATRFNGSPEMLFFMFALFGFVMLFGLLGIGGGAWQVYYARPNRKLTFIFLALVVIFLIVGRIIRVFNH
jgi:ribosomal protein L37E